MNPLNYASLEACKRLVDAGVVLETEAGWYKIFRPGSHAFDMVLSMRTGNEKFYGDNFPAPTMAEVWRELPDSVDDADLVMEKTSQGDTYAGYAIPVKASQGEVDSYEQEIHGLLDTNPTDALIDLLIWVRQKGKE